MPDALVVPSEVTVYRPEALAEWRASVTLVDTPDCLRRKKAFSELRDTVSCRYWPKHLAKGYVRKNLLQRKQPKPCEKGRHENPRGLGHPLPRRIQRRPLASGLLSASVSGDSFAPNARKLCGSPHRRSFALKHLCCRSIGIPCSQFNCPHLHPLSGLLSRLKAYGFIESVAASSIAFVNLSPAKAKIVQSRGQPPQHLSLFSLSTKANLLSLCLRAKRNKPRLSSLPALQYTSFNIGLSSKLEHTHPTLIATIF